MTTKIGATLLLLYAAFAAAQRSAANARGDYEISGKVVNAITGEVVRKTTVTISAAAQRGQTQHQPANADGSFQFRSLSPGKYTLTAEAPGFAPQSYEQHSGFSTAIAVGPEKTSTGMVFRMQPEGSISGQILDEHNEPVRDAHVLLFERGNDMGKRMVERRRQAQSDDQGQYHFHHLHPGTYYVAVAAQPWYQRYLQSGRRGQGMPQQSVPIDPALDVAYPVTYYPGATDTESAGAIVLHAGDRIGADFSLVPVPSLHLTIRNTNPDGGNRNLQPNFHERVFGEVGVFFQPRMNWGEGEVEVSGIAPGDYTLNLTPFDGEERRNRVQNISVQGNSELDALAVGSGLEPIHGQMKFEGAQPPRNPVIQLRDLNTGEGLGTRVEDNGEFKLQPQHPGRYVISMGNNAGYAIRNITATGARLSGRTIEITGQAVELAVTATEGVGTINGTVMKGDQPVSGTMVVLVPQDIADSLTLFRRDQSDSDGTFTLPSVVPGRYTVIAIQNGWDIEWASADALHPYLAKGTPVQIDGKQQVEIKVIAQ